MWEGSIPGTVLQLLRAAPALRADWEGGRHHDPLQPFPCCMIPLCWIYADPFFPLSPVAQENVMRLHSEMQVFVSESQREAELEEKRRYRFLAEKH